MHVSELNGSAAGGNACQLHAAGYNSSALGYDCALFARKFPRDTARARWSACSAGALACTNGSMCSSAVLPCNCMSLPLSH